MLGGGEGPDRPVGPGGGRNRHRRLVSAGGIPSNLYYRWSKDFLEAGKQRLVGDSERQADSGQVSEMRAELEQSKQLVAELS